MTRIIDSDAINKRVFRDIKDVDAFSRRIRGENLADNLTFGAPATYNAIAGDNFNFNGIEMSKVKQLINYLQTHKKEYKFDDLLDRVDNEPKETAFSQYATKFDNSGVVVDNTEDNVKKNLGKDIPNTKTEWVVPDGFDGRNSFVFPRIALLYNSGVMKWSTKDWSPPFVEQEKTSFVRNDFRKRVVEQNESFHFGLAMQGDVNNVNCWSAPIEGTPASWLMVAKNKHKITITTKANLAVYNCGYDADNDSNGSHSCKDVEMNNKVVAAYVYALIVYWRDK